MAAKAPDLSEFLKYSKPRRRTCKTGTVLAALGTAERRILEAALAEDPGVITAAAIYKWCEKRGHKLTHASVNVHRRQTCSCYAEE